MQPINIIIAWNSVKVSNGKSTSELNLNLLYSVILSSILPKVILLLFFTILSIFSLINENNLSKIPGKFVLT